MLIVPYEFFFRNKKEKMLSMRSALLLLFLALPKCLAVSEDVLEQYLTQRREIIDEESSDLFGADIILDSEEQAANAVLMKLKLREIGTPANSRNFLPSKQFSSVSKAISNSPLFKVIRLMPKGGVLHVHLSAVNSRNFILNNITDRENLYVCRDQLEGAPRLRFFRNGAAVAASRVDPSCRWRLLAEVREKDRSIDEEIDQALTMYASGERLGRIRNSNDAWRKFLNLFDFVKSLFSFKPVYEDYLYHVLEDMYKDNVQFVELRTALQPLYDLDGQQYQDLQVLEIFKKVVDRFMDDHADFVAVKIIYSPHRNIPRSTLDEYIGKFRLFQEAYPELVVGFDLVGQEDRGRPLLDFVDELLELGRDTRFYFHAGETNWNGHEVDENLIDAVLLNAKRIGHGFALIKHPKLMEIVKEKKIAVEVSPISNQVLKLVGDLRNHPAAHFFATNLPVVISNDDPGFWGATGLSHDYYEAFVGIMSRKTDLRSLKRLALNSIEHSSLSDKERALAEEAWTRRWKTFVRQIMMDSDDRETYSSSYYRYEI